MAGESFHSIALATEGAHGIIRNIDFGLCPWKLIAPI